MIRKSYHRTVFRAFISWLIILSIMAGLIPAGTAYAFTETSKSSYTEPVTEGVNITNTVIHTTDGTLDIYVMTVDLTNPYIKVDTLVGNGNTLTAARGVSKMARDAGAVAAINGDFFQMGENAPLGLTVQSGNLVTSPAKRNDMYGFGLTSDNRPVFTVFNFQGTISSPAGVNFGLSGINKPTYLADKGIRSDENTLIMYTSKWGAKSRGIVSGLTNMVEMVVENDTVKEIRTNLPAVAIPANGYVLAGHGAAGTYLTQSFKVGDQVQVSYRVSPENDNLMAALGGQALLVQSGKRHWFSQNITGKRARTAIGASQDGQTLYTVVVEGGNGSRGMTQEELADFMISIGAWTAVNLDGGGSSTMVARKLGDTTVSTLNTPVYTSERAIPTALGIFSTAPAGPLMGLKVTGPIVMLVGTQKTYLAKGYDTYYNPFYLNQADIKWIVSSDKGVFEENVFRAMSSGEVVLTAEHGNVSQDYKVKILGSADIDKLEVTPSSIAVNPGDSVNLSVKVTTKQGQVYSLQPGEYDIQVNEEVGLVSGGKFTAAQQMASGELVVKVDSTIARVRISVGGIERPLYDFETPKNLKFRGYPMGITLGGYRLTEQDEPVFRGNGAARLEYDFTKTTQTRAGYGNFEGGLLLPADALGLGLWVYGNNSGHWLRARITDGSGSEKLVDFAGDIDWTGWKHLKASIPSGLKQPLTLSDIYVVEPESGTQGKGVLYFDELTLIGAPTAADQVNQSPEELKGTTEALPGEIAKLKVGDDFEAVIDNPTGSADYIIEASQMWKTDLPTPGFYPVMPLYNIKATANGDDFEQIPGTKQLRLKISDAKIISKLRLMKWDDRAAKWIMVPSVTDTASLTVKGKTSFTGIFGLMEDKRPAPVFTDTGSSWAGETITRMAQKNVVRGFPDRSFLPRRGVTRAEFVTLLSNAMGWPAQTTDTVFKDEIPAWAEGSIATAVNRGIVKGYDDGTFRPNRIITRAEMAAIIDQALNLPDSSKPSAYKDAGVIPKWAVQSIRNTKVTGLMKGNNNMFRPGDIANRAEATAVMENVLKYYLSSL